jgi:hypothetical protein
MNSELLRMVIPEPTEEEIRSACRAKKDELGFDIEKALFPHHPFKDAPLREVSIEDAIKLARDSMRDSMCDSMCDSMRDSMRYSVRGSVWDSVWDSVSDSVRDSVWDSVWDSVSDSVRDSVRDSTRDSVSYSVRDSVRYSVRYSVRDSVRYSVWAYISSIFFNIEKWEHVEHEVGINPFQSSIDLWEAGYIPVYIKDKIQLYTKDGLTWEG